MPNPTTAGEWLREAIGEREAAARRSVGFNRQPIDVVGLAYLAALKAIVEIHRDQSSTIIYADGTVIEACECWVCTDGECGEMCRTLRTVAEVFRGREGYDRWFG